MGASSSQASEISSLPCDDGAVSLHRFLTDSDAISKLIIGAFTSALGVMTALWLAAALLPAPGRFEGIHPTILPSHSSQMRVEPREKAFVGLALVLGFAAPLLSISMTRRKFKLTRRNVFSLGTLVPIFNVCCDHALNQPLGARWALAGLLASMAIAWFALRFKPGQ